MGRSVRRRSGALLVDTDILIALASSGTLESVASKFGFAVNQLRRLDAAVPQIRRGKRFRDVYGEAVLCRILPIVESLEVIDAPNNLELLDQLNGHMDSGEALLLAAAIENRCPYVLTGDKNAVRALAESRINACIRALQGRIVILEAVLWMLVAEHQPAEVREWFRDLTDHKTLRVVLSEHVTVDHATCQGAIRSYYDEVYRGANGLLYNPDPDRLGL